MQKIVDLSFRTPVVRVNATGIAESEVADNQQHKFIRLNTDLVKQEFFPTINHLNLNNCIVVDFFQ